MGRTLRAEASGVKGRPGRSTLQRLAVGLALVVALPVAGILIAAYSDSSAASRAKPTAADYCRSKGGTVQTRYPALGTNDASALRLAGSARFCRFVSADDGSRIFVSLSTLYATGPTLAALAYLTQPPVGDIPGGPNPASIHCANLGGTETFGRPGAGGGWVSAIDEVDPVLQACVFPDRSMIDSWGITYHSWGTVRGRDLTGVFRYRSQSPPEVFG